VVFYGSTTTPNCTNLLRMPLADALALFRLLGVDVETMSRRDFSISYFALAKRYHPDRNPRGAELMANINAARTAIVNSYRNQLGDGQSRADF
jgi:curved DNA-binding protein CbpA